MHFDKSSPELIALFDTLTPNNPLIVKKKMFGYPVIFINGNMCCGLHGNNMVIRLPENQRVEFLQKNNDTSIFEPCLVDK